MTYGDRWRSDRDQDYRRDRDDYTRRTSYGSDYNWRSAWRGDDRDDGREHDRGFEPWGTTGRTYYGDDAGYRYGEGRDYAASRFQNYRDEPDYYSASGGRYGGRDYRSGYGDRGYGASGFDGRGDGRWGEERSFGQPGGRYSIGRERDREHEWGSNPRGGYGHDSRSWFDKASDEVQSWFGDEDAQRRRRWDEVRAGEHRGRGPKGYRRSDERIREDVSDRLTDDTWLDASDIDVGVKDGEVTLTGTVGSRMDKRRAEDLVERCMGVTQVQNSLRVEDRRYRTVGEETTANPKVTSATSGRA